MRRRDLLLASGALLAAPLARGQQAGKVYRIGYLGISGPEVAAPLLGALEQGLREHGYVAGKNLQMEFRHAGGKVERLPELARELVASKVDVFVVGTNPNIAALKAATRTIPIVFAVGTDVIREGFVHSLARPGGNITGVTWDVGGGTVSKAIELLKEVAPGITHLATLYEPPYQDYYREAVELAASKLRLRLTWIDAIDDFERGFAEAARVRANGAYVLAGARMFNRRRALVALAAKHRLPATYVNTQYVDDGGLMAYAPDVLNSFHDAARYVDKILKGASPGDLPVEQPTKIELVINLNTAKALGLAIPQSVRLRAQRVIE